MKRLVLQFLPFLALLIVFSSCKKDNDLDLEGLRNQPSAQEFIDKYVDQKIVFQYGELNDAGKMEQGWVINSEGKVMSFRFETSWESEGHDCSFDDMAKLENAVVEELGRVDLEELVANFKLIEAAAIANPAWESSEGSASTAFYAYAKRSPDNHNDSSNNSCYTDYEGDSPFISPYYLQVLLKKEGARLVNNHSEQAHRIMDWLETVQTEVGR